MPASLFDPLQAGDLALPNRIIMAPLTRARAGDSRKANRLMAEYYAQRASAGLIISEATAISAAGFGWKGAPAMYTDEHEDSWRQVTAAVHEKGGRTGAGQRRRDLAADMAGLTHAAHHNASAAL